MNYCRRIFSHDEIFAFIDPDCLVMKNIEVIRKYSHRCSIIGYELKIENDEKINGCSRDDLSRIFTLNDNDNIVEPPKYFGGELFVATGEALPHICHAIETVWETNKRIFGRGEFI